MLGDGHVQVVENLQHHRVDFGAHGMALRPRLDAFEHHVVARRHLGLPAGLDHGSGVGLGDDGRALDFVARLQRLAAEHRCGVLFPAGKHLHRLGRQRRAAARAGGGPGFDRGIGRAYGLDRHRLGNQAAIGHEEGIAPAISRLELGHHGRNIGEVDDQRRVGAVITKVHAPDHAHALRRHTLPEQFVARRYRQPLQHRLEFGDVVWLEFYLDRPLAHRGLVGKPHAVGRQHPGQRVDEHARHAQGVGHQAGVLPAGAAKAAQRVFGHVVAALHRNLLDGVGHVAHGDVDKALGHRFGRARVALVTRGLADVFGQHGEFPARHFGVQALAARAAEHRREELRLDFTQHDIAVGDRQRPVLAIRRRSGVGAGRIGTDAITRAVKMQYGTAARCNGVDAHHRRAHAHTGHLRLEHALEVGQLRAGKMRHVGGGATHVKADDFFKTRHQRSAHRTDDAAGRPRQDGILALEAPRIGKAAVRLHEHQAHTRQLRGDLVDITAQDRRQIGVDHGGIAARHQFHQRTDLVRGRDLGKAGGARFIGGALFILGKTIAVHEHDRHRTVALGVGRIQFTPRRSGVQRGEHFAARTGALVDFHHLRIKQFGQHDIAVKQARPVLVGDAQRIAETAGDEQQGFFTLAFKQGIGRDRGAHLYRFDKLAGYRGTGLDPEQMAYARHRGVAVLIRVLRQQLVRGDGAVGAARNDVGEGAAAIYPELPAGGGCLCVHFCGLVCVVFRFGGILREDGMIGARLLGPVRNGLYRRRGKGCASVNAMERASAPRRMNFAIVLKECTPSRRIFCATSIAPLQDARRKNPDKTTRQRAATTLQYRPAPPRPRHDHHLHDDHGRTPHHRATGQLAPADPCRQLQQPDLGPDARLRTGQYRHPAARLR